MWGATRPDVPPVDNSEDFNPRSPCGERHGWLIGLAVVRYISIHAPRVGSDSYLAALEGVYGYFNPRSPCGERRRGKEVQKSELRFQSTLPVWGATTLPTLSSGWISISIHAPRVGSDQDGQSWQQTKLQFQSTLPVWGATEIGALEAGYAQFQSTLPVWGATGCPRSYT